MRTPGNLTSLVDEGLIDAVLRPLLSGKEAEVFLVRSGGELRVAKVYKEAQDRTFRNRAEYTEGRKVRNSRDQRAIDKRTRHGRAQDEAAWRSTEVDMIHRLHGAGVRVPAPHAFIDGVLVMEMVTDAEGGPAPRLAEVSLDRDQAAAIFDHLLREVVRMLCADVVHGDLSEFNVLMSGAGPVIIDFPQSVDASKNQNARKLLLRDVANLQRFLARFAPDQRPRAFGEEMWDLYTQSLLTPETQLTGRHRVSERKADTRAVLELIGDADLDERKRRERQGLGTRGLPPAEPQGRGPRPPYPRNGSGGGQRPPPLEPPAGRGAGRAGHGGGQRPAPPQPYVGRGAAAGSYRPLPPPPPKQASGAVVPPAEAEGKRPPPPTPPQQPRGDARPRAERTDHGGGHRPHARGEVRPRPARAHVEGAPPPQGERRAEPMEPPAAPRRRVIVTVSTDRRRGR